MTLPISILKNVRGIGLVSVLISIPLAVLAALLVGAVISMTTQGFTKLKSVVESGQLQQDLRRTFELKDVCGVRLDPSTRAYNATQAKSSAGMEVAFLLSDGTSIARSNQRLDRYGVFVNSLKYRVYPSGGSDFSFDPRIPVNKLQYGEIIFNTRTLAAPTSIQTQDRSIGSVVMSVDPAGNISRCFLIDQAYDLCIEAGGIPDPDPTIRCRMPAICPSGNFYIGPDALGNPKCVSPQVAMGEICPVGMVLISNGAGNASCGSPLPAPAATPTPASGPTPAAGPVPASAPTAPAPAAPTPAVTPTPAGDPQHEYTRKQLLTVSPTIPAACKTFLSLPDGIDSSATNDVNVTSASNPIFIPQARNVSISSCSSSSIVVKSALLATISATSATVQVRSQYAGNIDRNSGDIYIFVLKNLDSVTSNSGDLCVSAQNISALNGSSGNHHIVATNIGAITRNSGTMHIYGATINKVSNSSSTICLHNGARIINYDSTNSGTVSTTCP